MGTRAYGREIYYNNFMITTVIFDMDGLLLSTEPIYFECYKKAAAEDGREFTYELFEACVGMSGEDSCDLIQHHFGPEFDVQKLIRRTYDHFEDYIRQGGEVDFRPGAKEAVEYFHRNGFKVALASSNIRQWVEYLLKKKGINQYFSSVTTADDVSKPKPDPEVYLKTAEKLATDVTQCLVFEDSIAGATAAISAGMRTCVVPQIKQPNTFVRQNAFKVYRSLEDIYSDMEDLTA